MVQWEGRVLIGTLKKKVQGKGNIKVMEERLGKNSNLHKSNYNVKN